MTGRGLVGCTHPTEEWRVLPTAISSRETRRAEKRKRKSNRLGRDGCGHGGSQMARKQARKRSPQLECLETRLQLSAVVPANSIGTSLGTVLQPGGISSARSEERRVG